MNKLRLFIGVGLCSILFTGCGFVNDLFHTGKVEVAEQVEKAKDCIPADLKDRISNRRHYKYALNDELNKNFATAYKRYKVIFSDMSNDGKSKCYDLVTESYNEAIKKAKTLPTSIEEERAFEKEWNICDKMPEWLETKLNSYVSQNEAGASNFKKNWQDWFSGKALYVNMQKCIATKKATQAIENDLIDLGSGKKAKCADLNYKDAPKCLAHFESTYNKTYKNNGLEGCTPADLKGRLRSYMSSSVKDSTLYSNRKRIEITDYSNYYDNSFILDGTDKSRGCNEWLIASYNETIKKTKRLPATFEEEEAFADEWRICDTMPDWLETTLNKYIEQNKGSDTEYIKASKFKESWENRLNGTSTLVVNKKSYGLGNIAMRSAIGETSIIATCIADKKAIQAIENDLIDLGNGKKVKCSQLSWQDSQKCQNHFDTVHNKVYDTAKKELDIKLEREKYEKKNKQ